MDDSIIVVGSPIEEFNMCDSGRSSILDSSLSTDSSFAVVNNERQPSIDCYPSLNTALNDGNIYERRTDIVETQNIPNRLAQKVAFYDKAKREEVLERINARENLDQEIENEVKHVEELQKHSGNADEILVKAAESARKNMVKAREVASNGKTTVKRAMEIIELALPAFITVWSKSQEEVLLNEEVMNALCAFEESREAVSSAGLDIDLRAQKTEEFTNHLERAIRLAENDVGKITKKYEDEEGENRIGNCKTTKNEIDVIVCSENEEIDTWLISCKSDREEIKTIKMEQEKRHEDATADHKKRQEALSHKVDLNKRQQDDLRKKLKDLENEERKMEKEKTYQQEVQKRAEELHQYIIKDMTERLNSICGIQTRADTSRKVIELMTKCGNELISSSIEAETEYLKNLKVNEKDAKQRLRDALANMAVEKQIKVENSTQNMNDCKENMKVFKEKWKKAAQLLQKLNAEKNKDSYEEYKNEMKREKAEKEKAEKIYEDLMKKLEICEKELTNMNVPFVLVNEMYEIRMQELLHANDKHSGMSSLDSDAESEDDFDDAES